MTGGRTERRIHPRMALASTILVQANELETLTTTRDIGIGGVRFLHMAPLEKGTPVRLDISLDDGLVQAEGRVVSGIRRGDGVYEMGIQFLSIDDWERRKLELFLARCRGQS